MKRARSRSRSRRSAKRYRRGSTRRIFRRARLTSRVPIHSFVKWTVPQLFNSTNCYYYPAITSGQNGSLYSQPTVSEMDISFAFQLLDLSELNSFIAMYDQYKITTVVLYVELMNNPNAADFLDVGNAAPLNNYTNFYPRLWYVRDHDDYLASSASTLMNYAKAKEVIMMPNRKVKIVLKPSVLQAGYGGNRMVVYRPPWNDCADTNTPHYGIKLAIDFAGNYTSATDLPAKPPTQANPNTSQWQFRIRAKYYVKMKTTR